MLRLPPLHVLHGVGIASADRVSFSVCDSATLRNLQDHRSGNPSFSFPASPLMCSACPLGWPGVFLKPATLPIVRS